jgi:hypothetical protein
VIPGCPRHTSEFSRDCPDFRCRRNWTPPNAPTPDEQLRRWVYGYPVCPNTNHECCPDLSCCRPKMLWPADKRAKFVAAGQGEREKMMMGSLSAILAGSGTKTYVTRGNPADRE